jgi:hypothetical protein
MVKPFGKVLNQDLMELFQQKLDLSEVILRELRATIESGRKSQRKPLTPTKKVMDVQGHS